MALKVVPLVALSAILLSGCTGTCGSKTDAPADGAAPAADAAMPQAPADTSAAMPAPPTEAPADAAHAPADAAMPAAPAHAPVAK